MFEDVKFDLDFSENQAKKETPKIQVANKSKIESSISSKAGATQGTQKSIFSLNDLFGDDSEILDISLNFDKKNKEEKGSYGRKSTHSARDSHLRTGPSTDQQSKFYDSTRDSHLRAGTSRDQQSKSYDSTRESQLRAGSRVGSSRNQQSRYYDSIGDSANDKSFQEGIKRGIEKPPGNTPKRRFPGPAGLLPIESTEQAVPDLQCSQENADENYVWIKALDDQGMQWGDPDSLISKYNVGHIKQNKKPGTSIRLAGAAVAKKKGSAKVAVPIALPQKIDLTKYVSGHGDLPNSQVTERLRPQTEDEEQKQLEAALKLSLMQDCTSSCTYRLASVVRHYGESANSGHYVADVHNFEQDAWFRFDDDRVSQVNKQEVHHSDNAYIVMYVRASDVDISRLSHDSKQNGQVSERGTNLQVPSSELVNPAKRVKRHLFQTIPTNQQSAVVLTPVKTIEPNREINLYKQSEPGSSPEYPIKLNLTNIRDFKLDVGEYLLDDQVKIDVLGIIYKDGKKFVVNDIDQVNIPSAYVCVKKRKEKYYLILTEK